MATVTDSDREIADLQARLDGDPGNACLRMELALALHASRNFAAAIEQTHLVLDAEPGNPDAWIALGRSQNNQGEIEAAGSSFRRATELDPTRAETWNLLGHAYRADGRAEAAREAFVEALRLAPDMALAHHNLATVYNELGETGPAADHFRRGLELNADDPVGWVNLADLQHVGGELADAEESYRRALAIVPDDADALAGLATLIQARNEHDKAKKLFERALEAQPAHAVALAGLAWHLELHGDPGQALALLEREPRAEPTPELLSVYARLLRQADREDEAIELLKSWQADARAGRPVPIHLLFSLGDLYDKQGDYDQAFECYRLGNERRKARFDVNRLRDQVAAQKRFFPGCAIEQLPVAAGTEKRPVFIVGLPRSGTSLVEQILAAHPAVKACGERDWIFWLARALDRENGGYPDCLAALTSARLAEYALEYIEGAEPIGELQRWVTDKLPANFLHLGLISRLFPGARVIHCQRDVLDTGLSCFRQNFKSNAMSFSHDLADIASYINEYQSLMEHWAEMLPLPILAVPYRDLVDDQETWMRRLIEFLDLPWDERCLRFYEIDRVVITTSYQQARKPIYRSSIGRWRYYERHLKPLITGCDIRTHR